MTNWIDDVNGPLEPFETYFEEAKGGVTSVEQKEKVDVLISDTYGRENSIVV